MDGITGLKCSPRTGFFGNKMQYSFSVCYFKAGSRSELSLHLVSDSYVVYSGISIPVCTEISFGLSPDFGIVQFNHCEFVVRMVTNY